MALLPNVFVPEDAEAMEFKTLPAGWYLAELVKSELKDTNAKDGKYLALKFRIVEDAEIDGVEVKSEGRFVFTNLNIVNKNETAVKLARFDLKKICAAVGHEGELEDTVDLHNIELQIKLSVKAATSEWPERNEIKGYRYADGVEIEFDDAGQLIPR